MLGTQRKRRQHRSRSSAFPATMALVAALVAGIVAISLLSGSSRDDQAASVREVAQPARTTPSAQDGAAVPDGTDSTAGVSGSDTPSGSGVSGSPAPQTADPTPDGSTAVTAPTPVAPVVEGRRLRQKTKAELEAEQAAQEARVAARIASRPITFTLGTFNVLGSQHSAPGGDHRRYPPASSRSVGAANLMASHGVDVVGTQELQPDQLNAITSRTGFAAYPGYQFGEQDTDNSILYDPDRFEFVSGTSFTIRFMNADRPQTVLRLRDRETGREMYFVNMHASAGGGQYAVSRRAGHYAAIAEINELKQSGLPVFLTGDMNDREEFFCRVVPATGMVASIGGTTSGGCNPAPALAVDWVLGTPDVDWTDQWEDRSPIGRVSDHFFVSATANVAGQQVDSADGE